ncbi:family 78 glycoside hydrolase catalytic domain [Actinopolymorpha alba]|uniref:family 78 glycoside hydrolase catalytic domain n=1 Tax=Actinopolymorpha alba TaxID=533267 RepID=UPI0003A93232|nr:family 78 glycoside hydrolase catalytic domain [Actinopolymorpha alba]
MPLGLDDTAPLLSWKLAGSGRGRAQTAYQIRLVEHTAGDPGNDAVPALWDSGTINSAQTVDVVYSGRPLSARMRYVWAVRVTDESGRDSGWSEPSEFELGLLGEADWRDGAPARWIGAADEPGRGEQLSLDFVGPGRQVERIWLPSVDGDSAAGDGAYFRVRFSVPDDRRVARARLVADAGTAEVRAYVNGASVTTDGVSESATLLVRPGDNILAVAVRATEPGAEAAALVARLDVEFDDGPSVTVVSDGTWRCRDVDEAGWEGPEYADASWPLARGYGLHGTAPYGRSRATYRPSPYLRKGFELPAPVRRARLYATALGIYEVRLNGQRVGGQWLTPGWTDYAIRVPYQTYDVTALLAEGPNVLAGILADGWYAGNVCWFGAFQYGDKRLFRARLEIEHTDGSRTLIVSDNSWRVGEGATRYADLQNGEVIDARQEPIGWDRPGFDDSTWTQVAIDTPEHGPPEAQVAPPIRVEQEVPAVSVQQRRPGTFLIDFGQNLVGWVRLNVRGAAGTRLLVRHAEVLDHRGELYVEALRSAVATDEYTLRGDPEGEVFEPRFTVHGFRFCEVVGHPGVLEAGDITALVAYARMEQIGALECSDERLNQLQHNIVWGQRGNFLTVPTDCPQRDERLGWTGDAQVFASTAAFNYDVRSFFRKWLRDLRDGQQPDGGVPHVAPDVLSPHSFLMGGDGRAAAGAAGWGDAIAIVPAEILRAYADRRLAAESLDAVNAWLRYLEANSTGHIRPDEGFADWLAPTPTPKDLVSTAFFAYAARVAVSLARELDRPDDAARWEKLYADVRAAFRDRYVRGGGTVVSGTQTAYVLALHFGLLEPAEEPMAARHLVEEIASRNWHLATGFLGTPYLLPVLSRFGHEDVAFRLLTQDTYPSWLYPVVHGDATTMWERWDSWSDSRGFQDPHMTSFNHYAYGAVGEWMYQTLGGIAPGAPGYQHVVVRPRAGGGITWAKAALDTVHGPVTTQWRLADDTFALDVSIPPNTTAEVWLPTPTATAIREGDRPAGDAEGVVAEGAVVEPSGSPAETVLRVGSGSYAFHVTLGG